jgi:hypothetical protein
MRKIMDKIFLFIVILIVIICPSCSASSPAKISGKTNEEREDLAIYFRILDKSGEALNVPGSVKIIITGDGYKINEQASDPNAVIRYTTPSAGGAPDFTYALDLAPFEFEKEFSLTESDYTRLDFPGYTYITKENTKDPWGYKISLPITEIQPIYLEYASKYSDYPSLVAELTGSSTVSSFFPVVKNVEIDFTTVKGVVIKGNFY